MTADRPADTPEAKPPAWKAWTYQRRLERFSQINPEPEPPVLSGTVITSTLRSLLDVREGRRSWRTLEKVLSPEVALKVQTPGLPSGTVRRLRVCRVDGWAVEVAAVIGRTERCTAMALRWDWSDDGWRITALEG